MKSTEKILLGIWIVFFGLHFLDFDGNVALFGLATWALALGYAIGGYKLFQPKNSSERSIAITAGIAFAAALYTIPLTIVLRSDLELKILPVLNGLFLLAIGIYTFILRKTQPELLSFTKGLLIRSLVIFTVSSVLAYCPITFKPYRKLALVLNTGNESITKNLLMFDYGDQFEQAQTEGDCEASILYAEKAQSIGLDWLGITLAEDGSMSKQDSMDIWGISKTYTDLYKAYRCKAAQLYNQNNYKEALKYYLKAHPYMYVGERIPSWEIEKSYSLNSIALCYQYLENYEKADSIFLQAIAQYKTVSDSTDAIACIFLNNLADSYSDQGYYSYANAMYFRTVNALIKDSTHTERRKDITDTYIRIAKNYMRNDSIPHSILYLQKALALADHSDPNYCAANLYYAVCLQKMSKYKAAEGVALQCLECYQKDATVNTRNIAGTYQVLSIINLSMGQYKKAEDCINKGIALVLKENSKSSTLYASYLKVYARVNLEIAKYDQAEKQLHEVLNIYTSQLGQSNNKSPEALAELANLEVTLGKFQEAQSHSDASMVMAAEFLDLNFPSVTSLLNEAAYINYCTGNVIVSDSLYKKSIRINRSYGLDSTINYAISLNGWGLLQTKRKKYVPADSLFQKSLTLHRDLVGDNHPSTAVVYINYATLKIELNRLDEARTMLSSALQTSQQYYTEEHDVFADIYIALGDLARKEKQAAVAKTYYQKAAVIYRNKFGERHYKALYANQKFGLR